LSIVNLFPSLDCHLGWPARLPFEYGIESNSSLISFLFLTGNDMACDDMRESTSKTFWVSLMVNCWPICKLGSTCHAEMYVNTGQNDSGKVYVPRPIQRTSNRKRNLKNIYHLKIIVLIIDIINSFNLLWARDHPCQKTIKIDWIETINYKVISSLPKIHCY
jgi:hypothetical protein